MEKQKNPFVERYRSASLATLLEVLESRSDYQPTAVEAAEEELSTRSLSEEDIKAAREEVRLVRLEKQQRAAKYATAERKLNRLFSKAWSLINPFSPKMPSAERVVRLIVLVFGLIAVYAIYDFIDLLVFMLSDPTTELSFDLLFYLPSTAYLPISIILFGLRKKAGWILLSAYLTVSSIEAIGFLIMTWNYEPSGIPAMDILFYENPPTASSLLQFLFHGAVLSAIIQPNIRERFGIKRSWMLWTLASAAAVSLGILAYFW